MQCVYMYIFSCFFLIVGLVQGFLVLDGKNVIKVSV